MASLSAILSPPDDYGDDVFSLEEAESSPTLVPGDDEPVAPYEDLTVIQAVLAYKTESEEARRTRDALSKINYDAANCRQMGPPKAKGQSQEFLPKTPMALEQLGAFIQRGLVAFGNWFTVELTPDPALLPPPTMPGPPVLGPQGQLVPGPPVPVPPELIPPELTSSGIQKLMRQRLESPDQIPPGGLDFPTVISDGVKHAALSGLLVLKVHGQWVPTRKLSIQQTPIPQMVMDPITGLPTQQLVPGPEELVYEEGQVWRLLIELVRAEDYYPDPTGRGLYEIHKTCKDFHEIASLAEAPEGKEPWYDPEAVSALAESLYSSSDYQDSDHGEADLEEMTDQDKATSPSFRRPVECLEFWGTLLDSSGNAVHRNVCAVIANEKFLIKRPYANPNWHQESPFVVGALLRVPFSVFHKALFDNAVRLNLAMNELFNLIIDAGLGAVWGIRWFKPDAIENADQLSEGIPQGATLFVKAEVPDGEAVAGQIKGGEVPADAMATYQLLDREYGAATLISETARGQTNKDVSATATASADQSTAVFFDSIIANLEQTVITKALRLAWLTMLQNADDWLAEDVVGCIGPQTAQMLAQMSPAARYVKYAQGARFKVFGLSSMLARTRDFQKYMAVAGAIAQSPLLMQPFVAKYSLDKFLGGLLKSLNLDPDDLQMTEEERLTLLERMQEIMMFAGMARGGQGSQQSQMSFEQQPNNPTQQVQADINQQQQVPEGL